MLTLQNIFSSMFNSFGTIFRLTSFGESHGAAIGGVIDGCPAGIMMDTAFVQQELDRRRPGQSSITTPRKEGDKVEFLSGIFEGQTTGAPIGFIIRNENQHSSDYDNLKSVFRPSHADYTYHIKYGIRDYRGGGRSSARETISRCVVGAVAKLALQELGVTVVAYTSQVGTIKVNLPYSELDLTKVDISPVRCPDLSVAEQMMQQIAQVRSEGDSIGGIITCVAKGVPAGLGEPVYGKLHQALGSAMLSINAVKGVEFGCGFNGAQYRGSEANDIFYVNDNEIHTLTNHSGGIQGGISNGEDIYFNVAFKPVPTLLKEQPSVDTSYRSTTLKARGRHDPCVLPRAVPVVESMTAMVLLDCYLLDKTRKFLIRDMGRRP
jgi:chorismate synthase